MKMCLLHATFAPILANVASHLHLVQRRPGILQLRVAQTDHPPVRKTCCRLISWTCMQTTFNPSIVIATQTELKIGDFTKLR